MNPQGKTRLKVWLVLLLVFVLGLLTGAALSGVYHLKMRRGPPDVRDGEAFFGMLQRDLHLNDQQSSQVHAVIDDARNDYRALREEVRPRFDAIRQKERERIRAVLTGDQKVQFDQMISRQDAALKAEQDRRERGDRGPR
jgi:hypothetical protein